MGFFDGLFSTIRSFNPMNQVSSTIRTAIIAFVIFIIFLFIWITYLATREKAVSGRSLKDRILKALPIDKIAI